MTIKEVSWRYINTLLAQEVFRIIKFHSQKVIWIKLFSTPPLDRRDHHDHNKPSAKEDTNYILDFHVIIATEYLPKKKV